MVRILLRRGVHEAGKAGGGRVSGDEDALEGRRELRDALGFSVAAGAADFVLQISHR